MSSGIKYFSEVLNQKGSPALYEDTLANRPAATFEGRLFFATDVESGDTIFRDNGDGTWSALAGNAGGAATNGLTAYEAGIGLGGTLTYGTTEIEGNTRVWRTKKNTYTQGFDLNFDSKTYQFGRISDDNDTYCRLSISSEDNFWEYINTGTNFQSAIFINQDVITTRFFNTWPDTLHDSDYAPLECSFNTYTALNFDFWDNDNSVNYNLRFSLTKRSNGAGGYLRAYNFQNIPLFANNAAAAAAGLAIGDLWHDNSGNLHIRI